MAMIHSRDQLLDWVQENAPRPCVKRASNNGGMVNLGTFCCPGTAFDRPYWIVVVCSPRDKFYYLAITPMGLGMSYAAYEIETVPWQDWIGDRYEDVLYSGDGVKTLKKFRTLVKGKI